MGKYHCTVDLMIILFGFCCFSHDELKQFYLLGQIQASQTGGHRTVILSDLTINQHFVGLTLHLESKMLYL